MNDAIQPTAELNNSKTSSSDAQIRALADRLDRHFSSIEHLAELKERRKYRRRKKKASDEATD